MVYLILLLNQILSTVNLLKSH